MTRHLTSRTPKEGAVAVEDEVAVAITIAMIAKMEIIDVAIVMTLKITVVVVEDVVEAGAVEVREIKDLVEDEEGVVDHPTRDSVWNKGMMTTITMTNKTTNKKILTINNTMNRMISKDMDMIKAGVADTTMATEDVVVSEEAADDSMAVDAVEVVDTEHPILTTKKVAVEAVAIKPGTRVTTPMVSTRTLPKPRL